MRVVEGPDGTVGLLVKPIEGRGLSDIEGTMWLDTATAQLQSIEYSYVNFPARIRNLGDIGGEVVFSRLPNGTWIVGEWRVRTPLMAFIGRGVQMSRIGYHDEGGVAWRAIDRTGTAVLEAGTGTVTGTLVDSAGQPPSGGVLVRTGLGDEARSSANDGSVVLGGLAGGLWRFTMSHPSLDTLGLRPPLVEVVASLDEVVGFRYQLPSASQLLVDACGGPPGPPILLGRVRTHDGESGGRTHLRVSGNTPLFSENGTAAPPGGDAGEAPPIWVSNEDRLEATTDARGVFLICEVSLLTQAMGPAQVFVEIIDEAGRTQFRRVTFDPGQAVQIVTLTLDPVGR
jgi:hypothetical protein